MQGDTLYSFLSGNQAALCTLELRALRRLPYTRPNNRHLSRLPPPLLPAAASCAVPVARLCKKPVSSSQSLLQHCAKQVAFRESRCGSKSPAKDNYLARFIARPGMILPRPFEDSAFFGKMPGSHEHTAGALTAAHSKKKVRRAFTMCKATEPAHSGAPDCIHIENVKIQLPRGVFIQ